jgi:aminoglycoside 6'-N-acetyltransferase I
LWGDTPDEHADEVRKLLAKDDYGFVIALDNGGTPVGIAEASIRNYVNGVPEQPTSFLEGIYVEAGYRNTGVGAALLQYITRWAVERGFKYMGSDVTLENTASQQWHKHHGFREVARVVCYYNELGEASLYGAGDGHASG